MRNFRGASDLSADPAFNPEAVISNASRAPERSGRQRRSAVAFMARDRSE